MRANAGNSRAGPSPPSTRWIHTHTHTSLPSPLCHVSSTRAFLVYPTTYIRAHRSFFFYFSSSVVFSLMFVTRLAPFLPREKSMSASLGCPVSSDRPSPDRSRISVDLLVLATGSRIVEGPRLSKFLSAAPRGQQFLSRQYWGKHSLTGYPIYTHKYLPTRRTSHVISFTRILF